MEERTIQLVQQFTIAFMTTAYATPTWAELNAIELNRRTVYRQHCLGSPIKFTSVQYHYVQFLAVLTEGIHVSTTFVIDR